jgi:TPR repeat protein
MLEIWKTKNKGLLNLAIKHIKHYRYVFDYFDVAENAPLPEVRKAAYKEIIRFERTKDSDTILAHGALKDPDSSVRLFCYQNCQGLSLDVHKCAFYDPDISIRQWAYDHLKSRIPKDYDVKNPEYILDDGKPVKNPKYQNKKPVAEPAAAKTVPESAVSPQTEENASPGDSLYHSDRENLQVKTTTHTEENTEEGFSLRYTTRGNLKPENRNYLFIHSFADISKQAVLTDNILNLSIGRQLALFAADPPESVFGELIGNKLNTMNIYLPVIDKAYLEAADRNSCANKDFFTGLQEKGIYVLPVITDMKVFQDFSRCFGETHAILFTQKDAMKQIEKEIERFIHSDDWAQKVLEQAFTKQLFLSYRHVNSEYLMQLMRAIHDTPVGSDAAIWYDDYLIPGRDYRQAIRQKLSDSNAVVLMVTPQLAEKGNYVLDEEYPYAKLHKPGRILPVEMCSTKPEQLSGYSDLPQLIQFENRNNLDDRLSDLFGRKSPENDREKNFLLGICFLQGIMVEKDTQRALSLLESAAEDGHVNACKQLFEMYNMGYGVRKDADTAFRWRRKQYDLVAQSGDEPRLIVDRLYEILINEYDGLIVYLGNRNESAKAEKITADFCSRIDSLPEKDRDETLILRRIEAQLMFIETLGRPDPVTGSCGRRYDTLTMLEPILNELQSMHCENWKERDRLKAIGLGLTGAFLGMTGLMEKAEKNVSSAVNIFDILLKFDPDNYDLKIHYRNTLGILGNLQFICSGLLSEDGKQEESQTCLKKAHETYQRAYQIADELVDEHPVTNNLECLVDIIFHFTQTFDDSIAHEAVQYWKKGSKAIDRLVDLGNPVSNYSKFKWIFDKAEDFLPETEL